MKKLLLTIGFLSLFLFPTMGRADFCDLGSKDDWSGYRTDYCAIRVYGNRSMEDDIFKAIENQTGYPLELVKLILNEGNALKCEDINALYDPQQGGSFSESDKPDEIGVACDLEENIKLLLGIQNNLFISYNQEKSLLISQRKLEQEFKASEKYWDGQLNNLVDVPFDLMVDLNLVETVLFGSQGNWTYDVFTFPEPEEDEEEDEEVGPLPPAGFEGEEVPPEGGGVLPDPGLTTESEEIPGSNENCIPNQGSADAFPNCGNGEVEILLGEACDDGNKQAGDGCSPSCTLEQTGSGGLNQCIDPEAVTFTNFADISGDNEGAEGSGNECPPGTHSKTDLNISSNSDGTGNEPAYAQSSNYPGPFVGGTLKNLPPSNRPACPVGQSEVEITLINGEIKKDCIPTEFCADFDKARGALFGEGWQQNDETVKLARSIEALFCVEVIPWNGPQNQYNPDEGCVDCHIRGMAQSLEQALQTNVTPLANTMTAFSISNPWGPNLTFDLTTLIKSRIRAANVKTPDQVEAVDQGLEEAEDENKQGTPSIDTGENSSQALKRQKEEQENLTEARAEWLQDYDIINNASGDVALGATLKPLLSQMESMFENTHEAFSTMSDIANNLAQKDMCQ